MLSSSNNEHAMAPVTGAELAAWMDNKYPGEWDFVSYPIPDEVAPEWAELLKMEPA